MALNDESLSLGRDINRKEDDCGCRFVYCGPAGMQPQGWVRTRTCPEHEDVA